MLQEQEGDKLQITVESETPVEAPTDIAPGLVPDAEHQTYRDKIAALIGHLTQSLVKDLPIVGYDVVKLLNIQEDNSRIRDWLVTNGVMTKAAFDKALRAAAREAKIDAELGFIPKDAEDFVREFAKARNVTLTPSGIIVRQRAYKVGKGMFADTVTHHNAGTCDATQLVYDVANAEGANLDSFGRELRLLTAKLDLGYRDSTITDAIEAWREDVTRQLKVDAMLMLQFEKGKATGEFGQKMWADMETACFDTSSTGAGFPTAVIKKFMWQVKRKARNMPITNHLMPVLSGPQGLGKTEFVKSMTKPLEHFKREVDFNLLTDGKTADIWSSLILFIDEMGFFKKADVDVVKNVITADARSIRTMRQNSSAPVKNHATLIGCTNKSLAQLIRDETGGRRFAELVWSTTPDWDKLNQTDWMMLWKSVDENGPDPLVQAGMMDVLRQQQEENRNESPIELWISEFGHRFTDWTKASVMFAEYREWEKDAFPRADTNQSMFGKNLTNLITSLPGFPMEKKQRRNGINYKHKGEA